LQQAALRTIGLSQANPVVVITSEDANENGTLVVDNTQYTCPEWTATHTLSFRNDVEITMVLSYCRAQN
jgi:hypothetical protein